MWLKNTDIVNDPILWSFRIKKLIKEVPGVFLTPAPADQQAFTIAFLPLLKAMMSVDTTANTLNKGRQGKDPQFSSAHLQRFLENLDAACGGPAKSAMVKMGMPAAGVPDKATPITALGFKYHPTTFAIDWNSDESKALLTKISALLMQ